MFFLQMVALTAIGALGIRWTMKASRRLGHDDFAYDLADPFSHMELGLCDAITSAGIFCGIFLVNSLLDKLAGIPIEVSMANKHIATDLIFAGIASKVLLGAMLIEGMRIRRRYYELVAPRRKMYLSFPKDRLVRPSFFELYRMW